MATIAAQKRDSIKQIIGAKRQAWPTLILFACGVGLLLGAWNLYALGKITWLPLFAMASVGQYCLYTCMHEAVHRLVSPWEPLNHFVGLVSASSLFAPFLGFQHVHLKHHRFTNHPGKDPDLWSASSALLLRWVTQDIYYYYVYLLDHRRLPLRQRFEAALQFGFNLGILIWLVRAGLWPIVVFGWLLPSRLVVGWLSFVFNFLPHHPHDLARQDSPFKETVVRPQAWLTPILLFQNFHNVHHLYPGAPFFLYGRIWREGETEFLRLGTSVEKGFHWSN